MNTVKERLKGFIEYKGISVRSFESTCGLSYGYVGNMRQSIQPDKVKNIAHHFPELNTGWLLTGEGEMLKTEPEKKERGGIPLLPNEAFAGYGAYQYSDLPVEEFYTIREFRNANFMLRVSGDSMAPKFNGGDLVACQKVPEVTFWQWHRIYAICTRNQGILLKRVEDSGSQESLICVSENPAYPPFTLRTDEIISVALVLGGVVME